MRLSNLADYAVVTMTAAARHCGGSRVSSAQLAAESGLPVPTVQKLVSKLTAAGLLRSSRGAGGGLQLARPAAAITLADIIEAVEGPIALTSCIDTGCADHAHHDCAHQAACQTRAHWGAVNDAVRGALADVPLTQFSQRAPHVPRVAPAITNGISA